MSKSTIYFDRHFGHWAYPVHRWLYQHTGGRIGGHSPMGPMLLLTTTGRKSGQPRTTPLLYVPDGSDFLVVASNGGRDQPPAWLLNLRSRPEASVQVGGDRVEVTAEILAGTDKEAVWSTLMAQYRGWDEYQQLTDREIPAVRLRRSAGA
jgi:deazaflavin-dependent oxidoreductase (nitroreductase family)